MGRATSNFLAPPPRAPRALGRGQKVKYHLISIIKSISKSFIQNFVCVLTNERYISDGIFILSPGSCPRGGTLVRWGCQGGQKKISKHGHVVYQFDGDDEQNRMQVKILS